MFRYGSPTRGCEFDDRTLAHLALVIIGKIRRGEEFTFSFGGTDGPTSLRMTRSAHLRFDFEDSARVSIIRDWIEVMEDAADSPDGLRTLTEPHTRPLTITCPARVPAELAHA